MRRNHGPHIPARCKYLQQLCKCFTSRLATLRVRGEEQLLFLVQCNFTPPLPPETTKRFHGKSKRFLLLQSCNQPLSIKFTRLLARQCRLGLHRAWLINQFGCDAGVRCPPQKNMPPGSTDHKNTLTTKTQTTQSETLCVFASLGLLHGSFSCEL